MYGGRSLNIPKTNHMKEQKRNEVGIGSISWVRALTTEKGGSSGGCNHQKAWWGHP